MDFRTRAKRYGIMMRTMRQVLVAGEYPERAVALEVRGFAVPPHSSLKNKGARLP